MSKSVFSKNYFTKTEVFLWLSSVIFITASFILYDGGSIFILSASLIGVTSLIFNAKGNPFGQLLMVIFSIFYGIISYSFSYFGEMITYLGMTAPMALFALISWLKNPYNGNKAEVRVNRPSKKEIFVMFALSGIITVIFYYILKAFNTQNLFWSTLSVTTSFIAVYLTARRSPYFALAYAANDIVLIVLWFSASIYDFSYISVVICFVVFLVNDLYGFINWQKIEKRQKFMQKTDAFV